MAMSQEPWTRAHRLAVAAIFVSILSFTAGVFSAAAGWLKIPMFTRFLGLEDFSPESTHDTSRLAESDPPRPEPPIEIVRQEYKFFVAPGLPRYIARVTWRSNDEGTLEIFREGALEYPFQSLPVTLGPKPRVDFDENDEDGEYFKAEDLNFDGFADIRVLVDMSGCCLSYTIFVYHPYLGVFEEDRELNEMLGLFSKLTVLPREKEIRVSEHSPPDGAIVRTYKLVDSDFVLIHYEDPARGGS